MQKINSIEFLEEEIDMCDIEVDEAHCFFYNGVVAHNCKDPNWLEPLKQGLDLHKHMAIKMFGEIKYNKELRKKAKYCLGDNSFIFTQRGFIRPKYLLPTDLIYDRNFKLQKFKLFKEDNHDIIEISYSNGIVEEYKSDHSLLIWDGKILKWKVVSDLTDRDQVVGVTKLPFIQNVSEKIIDLSKYTKKNTKNNFKLNVNNKYFAYLIGLYLGDGNISRGYNKNRDQKLNGFRVFYSKKINDFIKICVNKLGFEYYRINEKKHLNNNELEINSRGLCYYIDLEFGSLDYKTIPDWIFSEWDVEILSYFLAGLIDSDGKVKNKSVAFCNTNLELINKIALICVQLGIKTSLTKSKSGVTKNGIRSYVNKHNVNYKIAYELNFYDIQDIILPIQLEYKKPKKKKNCFFGWVYDDFFKKNINETKKSLTNSVFTSNFKRGLYKQIPSKYLDLFHNLDLKKEWQPLKVLETKQKKGTIYVIETNPSHEYISSGVISHNCNFGLIYGGSYRSLMQSSKLSENECKELYNTFWKVMITMKNWITRAINRVRENDGNVYSYFGRPRRLKYYLSHSDKSINGFGERSVVSHTIQSTGSDIMRIVLIQLYKKIFKEPENLKEIQFSGCVHDEINTVIRKDCIYKWYPIIKNIMEMSRKDWELPMETSIDLGTSYGDMYPFELDSSGILHPKKA